ncbi:MAG: aminotransferase class IV, partial [Sphingobacteriales bacterium]|nr:aminotransferase class IV [Sphingobacteriales bacterium]
TWQLPEESGQLNNNGLVLGIYKDVKKSYDVLSNLKHNNYLPYVMAALYAKKEKWNDAVILNTEGRLCDTAIANIFIIKDTVVYTPALSEACVAGVMRQIIVNNLAAVGVEIIEKELSVDELLNADEVFITNTIRQIQWVQSIGDKTYINMQIQKICALLSFIISPV